MEVADTEESCNVRCGWVAGNRWAAERAGRYSRCVNAVFMFFSLAWLSCGLFFWVHPAFLADNVTQKQDKTCLMLLTLQLLPNVSATLEQTHIVNTNVAKQTIPIVILFI